MTTTRTIGPLHFEDLEPHRFEDLVRQLVYDFREWNSVEAIGRAGSDKGMDIRAVEVSRAPRAESDTEERSIEEVEGESAEDLRTWVFQCKRQARIGPKRAEAIVEEFLAATQEIPHGYALVAACDFSAAAREAFRLAANAAGIEEFFIRGKGEIEDRLYLPKNDHLLFAYFGISLRVRRRSKSTQLAKRLTLKRKLTKVLGDIQEHPKSAILIRDSLDGDYPKVRDLDAFVRAPGWRYWDVYGHLPVDHLAIVFRKHYAYADWDTSEYDVLPLHDEGVPNAPLVHGTEHKDWDPENLGRIYHAHMQLHVPQKNQAWFIELRCVSYDRILLVDEIGDAHNPGPHLVLDCSATGALWEPDRSVALLASGWGGFRRPARIEELTRTEFFPQEVPDEREKWSEEMRAKHSQT